MRRPLAPHVRENRIRRLSSLGWNESCVGIFRFVPGLHSHTNTNTAKNINKRRRNRPYAFPGDRSLKNTFILAPARPEAYAEQHQKDDERAANNTKDPAANSVCFRRNHHFHRELNENPGDEQAEAGHNSNEDEREGASLFNISDQLRIRCQQVPERPVETQSAQGHNKRVEEAKRLSYDAAAQPHEEPEQHQRRGAHINRIE